jgi:hypothetical protein
LLDRWINGFLEHWHPKQFCIKIKREQVMEQLTINIPDEIAVQLRTAAQKSGVKPEDFMLASLQERLANVDAEFIRAMRYVLKKNAELYKRLA